MRVRPAHEEERVMFPIRVAGISSVLMMLSLSLGCADERPRYVRPPQVGHGSSPVAVLKGNGETRITEIDGAVVGDPGPFGFKEGLHYVTVTQGMHRLRVVIDSGKLHYWTVFDFKCDKGRTYVFEPNGWFDRTLKVTDEQSGVSALLKK